MKKIKIITSFLCVAISVFLSIFCVYAEDDDVIITDYDGREYTLVEPVINENGEVEPEPLDFDSLYGYSFRRIGDVNVDGFITAEDARYTLRCVAKLVSYYDYVCSIGLMDLDNNGFLNANDARLMLRIAAKLDPTPERTVSGFQLTTYFALGLHHADDDSYKWIATCDKKDGVTIKEKRWNNESGALDGVFRKNLQFFSFKADDVGEYKVRFDYVSKDGKNVADSFTVNFTLRDGTKFEYLYKGW